MANEFIIVIFPCNESLLFDQVFIVFSTFFQDICCALVPYVTVLKFVLDSFKDFS